MQSKNFVIFQQKVFSTLQYYTINFLILIFFIYLKVYTYFQFYLYLYRLIISFIFFYYLLLRHCNFVIIYYHLMKIETKITQNQKRDSKRLEDSENIGKTEQISKKCKKIEKSQKSINPDSTKKRKGPRPQVIQKNIDQKKYIGRPKIIRKPFEPQKQLGENYLINLISKQIAGSIRNEQFIRFFFSIDKKNGLVFSQAQRKRLNQRKKRQIFWSDKPRCTKQIELKKIKHELQNLKPQNDDQFQKLPFYQQLKQSLTYIFLFIGQIFCEETTSQLYKILREIFLICWQNSTSEEQMKMQLINYGHKIGSNGNNQYKFISFNFSNMMKYRLNKLINKEQVHHIQLVQKIAQEFCDLIQFFKKQKYLPTKLNKQQLKYQNQKKKQTKTKKSNKYANIQKQEKEEENDFMNYNEHDQNRYNHNSFQDMYFNDNFHEYEPMIMNMRGRNQEYQDYNQNSQQDYLNGINYEQSEMKIVNGELYLDKEESDYDILDQRFV